MFLLTFPVHYIIVPELDKSRYWVHSGNTPRGKCVAIYTELLFAERDRDACCPKGAICTAVTLKELDPHLELFEQWGFSHVIFDPGTQAGRLDTREIRVLRRRANRP